MDGMGPKSCKSIIIGFNFRGGKADNAVPARGQYPAACSRGIGPWTVHAEDVKRNVPQNL